jgi:DNA repair protein RadC
MNYNQESTLAQWAEEERPREKLMKFGARHLSNAELLAILLGNGTKGLNVVNLSRTILCQVNNNLHQLSRLELNDIKKFKGIGEAKAITILAALEFARRQQITQTDDRPIIHSSRDAFKFFNVIEL